MAEGVLRCMNYLFAVLMPFSHIGGYAAAGIGLFFTGGLRRQLRTEPFFLCLAVFICYGLARSFFSAGQATGFASMAGYFSHWLLPALLGFAVQRKPEVRRVLWIFGAVFLMIIAVSVFAYFGLFVPHIGSFHLVEGSLLKGFRSHIALAAISLVLSFLSVQQAVERRDLVLKHRIIFGLLAVFFLGAVFLTGSRGYYIAALLVYPAFGIRWAVLTRKWLVLAVGILVAAGMVMSLYVFTPYLRERIHHTGPKDNNVVERLTLYRVALQEIKDRPFFGFGPGQGILQSAYFDRLPPELRAARVHHHLHSFYLNLGADFGLTGLGIFFIMIWFLIARIGRLLSDPDDFTRALAGGVFWGIIAILIGDCFDTLLRGPGTAMELFWLAGLAMGMKQQDMERKV